MENTAATWSEPSKDQIAIWKKEHNSEIIHVIKMKDEFDLDSENKPKEKKAYVRMPQIDDLVWASGSEKQKPGSYFKSLFEKCVLSAHPDIRTKPMLYNAAVRAMGNIDVSAESELEKL